MGNSFVRYRFLDPNNNGLYDGLHELGDFITSGGGAAGQTIADDFEPTYVDEFSFSVEKELKADTGVRFSYVRKQLRNSWVSAGSPYYPAVNLARATENLTQNVDMPCPGCPPGYEGTTLHLRTLPPGAVANDNKIAQAPGDTDGNYDTIQFAVNRRFSQDFFLNVHFRLPVAPRAALARVPSRPARSRPIPSGTSGIPSTTGTSAPSRTPRTGRSRRRGATKRGTRSASRARCVSRADSTGLRLIT